MKHFRIFCIVAICQFLLSSCYTTVNLPTKNAFKVNFTGKTCDEIVKSLGAPNDLVTKENGEKVMIYDEVTWRKNGTLYRNEWNSVQQTQTPMQAWLHLMLNAENVCYDFDTNYEGGEVKVKSEGKTLGLSLGLGIGIPVFALVLLLILL